MNKNNKVIRMAVIMDPIQNIKQYKDTTFAFLLEAQKRQWQLLYIEQHNMAIVDHRLCARLNRLTVFDDKQHWFELQPAEYYFLDQLDVLMMRKDPPFDMDYVFTTLLLDKIADSVLLINRPQSLRDCNEKLFATQFPQCTPATLVSSQADQLLAFLQQHQDIILKPLDGMGGASIFRIKQGDPNTNVILETITHHGAQLIMAQRYIPEISQGDKRILLINGEAVPYALARIPAQGETRANIATGGHGVGVELSQRDRWICDQIAPELLRRGLLFVGIDVIGDYLTEINVTSATCVRELDSLYNLNIAAQLLDVVEQKLAQKRTRQTTTDSLDTSL